MIREPAFFVLGICEMAIGAVLWTQQRRFERQRREDPRSSGPLLNQGRDVPPQPRGVMKLFWVNRVSRINVTITDASGLPGSS
jgi:hypothetical protein